MLPASLGKAQEQAPEAPEQTATQQEGTQPFPIPVPVEIVESEESSQARQRSEEEARDREIEDLIAQQGMNAATQSIDAATQDMRDYALYSTLLVFVGTLLLFWTLRLTRQANAAALKSVEITEKMGRLQTQSYISFSETGMHFIYEENRVLALQVRPMFKNTGQIPGVMTYGFCYLTFLPNLQTRFEHTFDRTSLNRLNLNISSGETRRIDSAIIPIEMLSHARAAGMEFVVVGRVEYTDLFGGPDRHEDFCVAMRFHGDPAIVVNGQFTSHDWYGHQDYHVQVRDQDQG